LHSASRQGLLGLLSVSISASAKAAGGVTRNLRRAVVLSGSSFVERADRGFRRERVTRLKVQVRALVHSTRPFRKGL
jgi:hypothetical protein